MEAEAAEQKYDWGAGVRGYKAADYQCVGQELGEGGGGGLKPP